MPPPAFPPKHQTPSSGLVLQRQAASSSEGSPPTSPHYTGRKDIICTLNIYLYDSGKKMGVQEEK